MATSGKSALRALVRGVDAYFQAYGVPARVSLGWTQRDRQDNQGPGGAARVVFVPGEFTPEGGPPRNLRAGLLSRQGQQNDSDGDTRNRALAWWAEIVTCSVWAVDPDNATDEGAQIEATEDLLESTIQGIHNAVDPKTQANVGFANVLEWGPATWTLPPAQRAFGRELTFTFVLQVPMRDQPVSLAEPQPAVNRAPFVPSP